MSFKANTNEAYPE